MSSDSPSLAELRTAEVEAKKLLRRIFRRRQFRTLQEHRAIGLRRLTEKGAMARTMLRHMTARHLDTVDELAYALYIGRDCQQVLEWLRYPAAFRARPIDQVEEYLINLCDLEWEPMYSCYVPSKSL